jgi:nicotinamide-nucleotide amidase
LDFAMTLLPSPFSPALLEAARALLEEARRKETMIATVESCTGGLIAALLTEIPGSSDVFERGFVTYSNEAKRGSVGVPEALLAAHGAVSAEVALAMADGARLASLADVVVSVTGVAGPGGGSETKPVGLVWFGMSAGEASWTVERRFGDLGRAGVRMAALETAMGLLREGVALIPDGPIKTPRS